MSVCLSSVVSETETLDKANMCYYGAGLLQQN